MSDFILEEAQKGFREILEGKVQETWGKYLTEDKQDEVLHAVAELVAVDLVSLERRWCIANPDRLSIRFRGLIESILEDAFNRVGAFVIADNIADFSADVFTQIKLIIDDHSDSGSDNESENGVHAINDDSEVDEVAAYNPEDDGDDPSNAGSDEEASNGDSAMAVRLQSPGTDSIDFESDEGMMSDSNDENFQCEDQAGDPIAIDDEVDMDNHFRFSTPAGSDKGDESMAEDTLVDEDMADNTPTQDGMGNDPLFSSVARSDKGDQHMAANTFFDGGMEDNDLDLFGDDMGHYSFPAGNENTVINTAGDQRMAMNIAMDEYMAINTAGDQRMAMNIAIDEYMANDTAGAASAGLEEEDEGVEAVDFEGDGQVDDSSTALHHAMEFAAGQKGNKHGDGVQQAQGTPTKKGKGTQQGPRGKVDPRNNDLYIAVMDEEDPTWPPKFYKCKIVGCEFQGAWSAKQVHFEIKHPKEWKDATGCEAKVHRCPLDDCEFETTRSNYIARHLKSKHPKSEEAKALSKKGKKSKK